MINILPGGPTVITLVLQKTDHWFPEEGTAFTEVKVSESEDIMEV